MAPEAHLCTKVSLPPLDSPIKVTGVVHGRRIFKVLKFVVWYHLECFSPKSLLTTVNLSERNGGLDGENEFEPRLQNVIVISFTVPFKIPDDHSLSVCVGVHPLGSRVIISRHLRYRA